jgi:hypothetical protein
VLALSVQRTHSYRVGMGIFAAALLLSLPVFGGLESYPDPAAKVGIRRLPR